MLSERRRNAARHFEMVRIVGHRRFRALNATLDLADIVEILRQASTVAGRITLDLDRPGGLARLRSASRSDTVVPLPRLGPEAFLVLSVKPDRAEATDGTVSPPVGFPNDVTGGIPLPATAHWQHGDTVFTASGTRAGASVEEAKRITTRLAELLNRRPVAAPYS